MSSLFNVAALFILFRESLEAAIIIGVLLNYIKKTLPHEPEEQVRLRRQVWLGGCLGLAISVAVGIAFTVVFYVLQRDVFGSMEAIWEGTMKSIAVILITWMALGMIRAKNWYAKWEAKLEGKLKQQADADTEAEKLLEVEEKDVKMIPAGSLDAAPGSGALVSETISLASDQSLGTTAVESEAPDFKGGMSNRPRALFFMAFTIILREGLESVVFLTGVGQGQPLSIIIPGIIGISIGIAIGYLIYRSASTFKLDRFLLFSAIFLIVIAAGLAAGAAHEFEEIAYIHRNQIIYEHWDAVTPQNLTTAQSPANTYKELSARDLLARQDEAVDVAWSPPLRQLLASTDCPALNASSAAPASCIHRTYYIAAEVVSWDYAPSGYDHMSGVPFVRNQEGPGTWTLHGNGKIGAVYQKVLFFEYEDAAFTRRKAREADWIGLLGPVIRAEVGEVVKVNFLNRSPFNASMHPHGLSYAQSSEGAMNEWNNIGNHIQPNESYAYTWIARETSGPTPGDGNAVMWAYHSHVHEIMDIYTGMIGALVVYAPGILDATTDKPRDVDREFVTLFMVADENQSLMLRTNIDTYVPELALNEEAWFDDDFMETNRMHSVNGRMYNNLDGYEMVLGERIRWLVFAMGNEVDLHTAHWHGNTLIESQSSHRTDVIPLLPATFHTATMVVNDPGQWLYHCHVADHIHAGMISSYHVKVNASEPSVTWTVAMAKKDALLEEPESTPILWDASACCSENKNPFFQILNALIGWRAVGTVATVVTYFAYWIVVLALWWFMAMNERRKLALAKAAKADALETGERSRSRSPDMVKNEASTEERKAVVEDKASTPAI